ncbi:MAG: membrane protein insertase YidC [Deltaproteobacteria bacterium]|nr:membrane protein insertase YidC [Deltaproteobacteria bacterium]
MGDNKRLLIALALSVATILLYPWIYARFFPKPAVVSPSISINEKPLQKLVAPGAKAAVAASQPAPVSEELTTVETPLYTAVFTNRGGGVKSWRLKKYRETLDKNALPIDIVRPVEGKTTLESRVLSGGIPETISFKPSRTIVALDENSRGAEPLVFVWTSSNGVTIEKSYVFKADSYGIDTRLSIINGSKETLKGSAAADLVGIFESADGKGKRLSYHSGPIRRIQGKVVRQKPVEGVESAAGPVEWLGIEDKYFLSALIPTKDAAMSWESVVVSSRNTERVSMYMPVEIKPGEKALLSYLAFIGPKEYNVLKTQGNRLDETIEFGWFSFIAKPFLVVLNFFYRFLKNYGLAIIILTFITKVLFHPLTKHSMTSMKEMQKIQPQIAVVKEKYKNDREKLNRELVELYKRYKINPLSGCLPMVLQIPVFLGLYEVLAVAIELRHAPFFLWIHDLSAKDPYYITPVVMGVTMFVQQKTTPTAMDPTQAKMMLVMPVVMTFFFLNFPSGLVLYWLVNNVLSIIQQYQIRAGGGSSSASRGPGGSPAKA